MRMGRPTKKGKPSPRKRAETQNPNPPKFSSPTLVVGRVSSNVISSVLAPALNDLAVRSVEEHADAMMIYEQRVARAKLSSAPLSEDEEDEKEAELDLDGNIVSNDDGDASTPATSVPSAIDADVYLDEDGSPILPPSSSRRLFTAQRDVDELSSLLSDAASHFSAPGNAWKVHANAAKFERLLDEKYGRLRPFIESHPEIEAFVKGVQRRYAMGAMSPFRREGSPINKTTAIMVLFMMHRQNVRFEALVLVATFCLVGLQPWALVTLVALGRWEMERRKGKRVRGMPRKLKACEPYYARHDADNEEEGPEEERARKHALLSRPPGAKFNPADLSLRDEDFDVLLLGSGTGTLYAAALLARAGRRVCVLSPEEDVSRCAVMEKQMKRGGAFANVPFDVHGASMAHLAKQQALLAPALCTSTDTQGGIRFARIGSDIDGYAHSVLSVPGLGTDNVSAEPVPVVINAEGPLALAEYCYTRLGDNYPGTDLEGKDNGNSTSLNYIKACRQINAGSGDYYLSKLFAASGGSGDPLKSAESNAYQQATVRPTSAFLDKCLPLAPHVRCLMAAVGMCNENLSPDNASMAAHVTHLCGMLSEEGMSYPVGGPRALCHALTSVIEQCDGRVIAGASLQELLFEKVPEEGGKKGKDKKKKKKGDDDDASSPSSDGPKPRCRGVRLQNGCEVTVSDDGDGAVVSTLGLVPTFLHLLPADVRAAHGVPPGLPAVSERRPLMKVLVGLRGTRDELDLTGADWYRLPNAALPRDEVDPATGLVKCGTIGADGADDGGGEGEAPTEGAASGRGKRSKAAVAPSTSEKKGSRTKFTSGKSWMKVSFPSAKDPSWVDRHGNASTCVVTIEADDDFVRMFDTKPRIYSVLNNKGGGSSAANGEMERLSDRVLKDLVETFPQLEKKIECVQICGPYRSGLTQNPARFAIKGNRPKMPYPGLFIGGADLTVADSASAEIVGGWLAANAVMGYSFIDHLYLKKNITSDLQQFLEEPSLETERDGVIVEDLAVPFTEKDAVLGKGGGKGGNGPTNAAESTKEE